MIGWAHANGRRLLKRVLVQVPGFRTRSKFYRHRYPSLPLDKVREKLARFERLLGEARPVHVTELSDGIFSVGM